MKKLLSNRYFIIYVGIYLLGFFLMVVIEHYPINDLIFIFLIIGILFSYIAYLVSRSSMPIFQDRESQNKELLWISIIVLCEVCFLTYFEKLTSFIVPREFSENTRIVELFTTGIKLLFMVFLPLTIYHFRYGFKLNDWGITNKFKTSMGKKGIIIFLIMFIIIFIFQYFAGSGAKPLREGLLSSRQLIIGLPLFYLWLIVEVGIVEEFFFRAFLQSRLSVLLKSQIGGIVISALIFGLAHAPGIYLRGGGVLANLSSAPSFLLSLGYSITVLSLAGFFLAIIWAKTKNFWLIVSIHAFVDLLPGLAGFVELWGIK